MTKRNMLLAAQTLALAVLLAGCAAPPSPTAPGEPRTGARATRIDYQGGHLLVTRSAGVCTIRLQGEINPNTAPRLNPAFAEIDQADCREKWFELSATGGDLGSAVTVGSMLRNRSYQTRIAAGSTCGTPCWLVFSGGIVRTMAPDARIAFSQIPPDADFGRRQCETELSRGQALTLTRYLRAMLPSPVATSLFQRVVAADCRSTTTWDAAQARSAGLLDSSPM